MAASAQVAAILFIAQATWFPVSSTGCHSDEVAVYRITLETFWTEERFPKNYPQYRPRAQWSQTFGQIHNGSYSLYHLGAVTSDEVRAFSRSGKVDDLVGLGDEDLRIYDQFTASAIGKGEGKAENVFFVDGGHSLVSMICRLVPSPDWFVGVDSLELCVDSLWVDEVSLSLEPLDAGAASGLSFTAPHWQTEPPAPVTRHTARLPAHTAAGFYYPEIHHLPTIASVHFTKIKEYSNKDLNDLAHKEVRNKLNSAKLKQKSVTKEPPIQELTTKNNLEVLKDLEEEPLGTPRPNIPANNVIVVTEGITTSTTTEAEFDKELLSTDDIVLAVAHGRKLGRGKHLPRHFRSRLHKAINKITDDDCLVSAWGEWSACSVTCGFGDKFRARKVLRKPTPKGRACPPLNERTHCGNVNSCYQMDYFDW